jgi:hypothetical protein
MKQYVFLCRITRRQSITVDAEDLDQARLRLDEMDCVDDGNVGSEIVDFECISSYPDVYDENGNQVQCPDLSATT